jgi:hypothetical protein
MHATRELAHNAWSSVIRSFAFTTPADWRRSGRGAPKRQRGAEASWSRDACSHQPEPHLVELTR